MYISSNIDDLMLDLLKKHLKKLDSEHPLYGRITASTTSNICVIDNLTYLRTSFRRLL